MSINPIKIDVWYCVHMFWFGFNVFEFRLHSQRRQRQKCQQSHSVTQLNYINDDSYHIKVCVFTIQIQIN